MQMTWYYIQKTLRTQKLLELINKSEKVAGDKINIQKSLTFLYTKNEIIEKEYKNTISFKILPPKNKYLGIHLTKEVNDSYAEHYTFIKEIEEDSKKWKAIPCSWLGRIDIHKMAIMPKEIYKCNTIPFQLPVTFFFNRTFTTDEKLRRTVKGPEL